MQYGSKNCHAAKKSWHYKRLSLIRITLTHDHMNFRIFNTIRFLWPCTNTGATAYVLVSCQPCCMTHNSARKKDTFESAKERSWRDSNQQYNAKSHRRATEQKKALQVKVGHAAQNRAGQVSGEYAYLPYVPLEGSMDTRCS